MSYGETTAKNSRVEETSLPTPIENANYACNNDLNEGSIRCILRYREIEFQGVANVHHGGLGMSRRVQHAVIGLTVIFTAVLSSDSAMAQWRTHYVRRDGLFHVEKYHTGNGVTPQGANMIVGLGQAFAPIAGLALGREEEQRSRDMPTQSDLAAYNEELAKARDLLARTAHLVDSHISATPPPATNVQPPATNPNGQRIDDYQGPNPWNPRP